MGELYVTAATRLYRGTARVLSRVCFGTPGVEGVYARRSVAVGEARFPWSDLDLGIFANEAMDGQALEQLRRRYRLAWAAFPRLGECLICTAGDLDEYAATDPYRASLDRRALWVAAGAAPQIPPSPIPAGEAARRLVFWFDYFIPRALRRGSRQDLHKFWREMVNALGVLEGRWSEPWLTRAEAAAHSEPGAPDGLRACFQAAARAHRMLLPPAPALRATVELPGLVLVPGVESAPRDGRRVMTPEVLDLMLQTQNPALWWDYGTRLAELGFSAPSEASWRRAARRWAGGERVRAPGFFEADTAGAVERLRRAAQILGCDGPKVTSTPPPLHRYYLDAYETLAEHAAALRARAAALGAE